MKTLDTMDTKKGLKLLLIADSGAGKTVFATSFSGKTFVADFDKKISSAAKFHQTHNPAQLANITYENYIEADPKRPTMLPAERLNTDLGEMAKQPNFPYDTVVIDSLTTYSDEVMKYIIATNPGIKRMMTKGAQVPCQQDYQIIRIYFKQMISAIVSLPCRVVLTAHIETDKDETTGQVIRTPMMAGKLKAELPIYMEEVWRAYVDDKGQRWAQTQPDSKFTLCRTQIPGLPNPVKLDVNEIEKYLK